jgi:PAS domain-containing protein
VVAPRRRPTSDAIARLREQRREIVSRAVQVLDADREIPVHAESDTLRATTALLAISLEALKVAEEQLVQQNDELVVTRDAIESTSRHYRRLFDDMPIPCVVTDVCGIIRHANGAAVALLRRPADVLEREPLLTLVSPDRRSMFRAAMNRLHLVDAAYDWRVDLLRHGDAPVSVAIDVSVSRGLHDGEDLMCWLLRPVATSLPVKPTADRSVEQLRQPVTDAHSRTHRE